MTKKLGENGLWDGSRMIIPQHKDAILRQEEEMFSRRMPELAEDEKEKIEHALIYSYNLRVPVTLKVFTTFEDLVITGVVTTILTVRREVKLTYDDDYEWIAIENIISAEVDHFGD